MVTRPQCPLLHFTEGRDLNCQVLDKRFTSRPRVRLGTALEHGQEGDRMLFEEDRYQHKRKM